jgi:hypothetical protein
VPESRTRFVATRSLFSNFPLLISLQVVVLLLVLLFLWARETFGRLHYTTNGNDFLDFPTQW